MSDPIEQPVEKREESKPAETPVPDSSDPTPQEQSSAPKEEPKTDVATPAAPVQETEAAKTEEPKVEKPAYLTKTPALGDLFDRLPSILTTVGHDEMWGVQLKDYNDVPTVNVLIKFLRANEGNLKAAEDQLTKALKWRKEVNPQALAESGKYSAAKFGGLGYLTTYEENGRPLVFTWNIYGAVKDANATFANADEFLQWRAALMELAVQDLKMKDATAVIDYDGEDPYQMYQVHDYLNVKFLRMDPAVRTATKKVIDVFATSYPELLREKYFVNVPAIMGWMFSAMKLFLSRNTTRKFHPISNGANLAREFPASLIEQLPKVYGGKGPELKENARIVPLTEEPVATKEEAPKESAPAEAPKDAAKEEAPQEAANEGAAKEAQEETPKVETPKVETPKVEAPKVEAAKEESAKDGAQ